MFEASLFANFPEFFDDGLKRRTVSVLTPTEPSSKDMGTHQREGEEKIKRAQGECGACVEESRSVELVAGMETMGRNRDESRERGNLRLRLPGSRHSLSARR